MFTNQYKLHRKTLSSSSNKHFTLLTEVLHRKYIKQRGRGTLNNEISLIFVTVFSQLPIKRTNYLC